MGGQGYATYKATYKSGLSSPAFTEYPRETAESRCDNGFCLPGTGGPENVHPWTWYDGLSKEAVHEFLQQGLDVLVVTLSLTDNTNHLLGEDESRTLRQGTTDRATVVNAS